MDPKRLYLIELQMRVIAMRASGRRAVVADPTIHKELSKVHDELMNLADELNEMLVAENTESPSKT